MSSYRPVYAKSFDKCLKKHQDRKKRIEKLVQRVLKDPKLQSYLLTKKGQVDLRGKRRRHLGGNFVIVYMVCDECIDEGFRKAGYNNCSFCEDKPAKQVVFLAFSKHDDIYSKQWTA